MRGFFLILHPSMDMLSVLTSSCEQFPAPASLAWFFVVVVGKPSIGAFCVLLNFTFIFPLCLCLHLGPKLMICNKTIRPAWTQQFYTGLWQVRAPC